MILSESSIKKLIKIIIEANRKNSLKESVGALTTSDSAQRNVMNLNARGYSGGSSSKGVNSGNFSKKDYTKTVPGGSSFISPIVKFPNAIAVISDLPQENREGFSAKDGEGKDVKKESGAHRGYDIVYKDKNTKKVFDPGKIPVVSVGRGKVFYSGKTKEAGNLIVIDHGDSQGHTLYCHLEGVYVSKGTSVSLGQEIGTVGKTGITSGTHLHFGYLPPEKEPEEGLNTDDFSFDTSDYGFLKSRRKVEYKVKNKKKLSEIKRLINEVERMNAGGWIFQRGIYRDSYGGSDSYDKSGSYTGGYEVDESKLKRKGIDLNSVHQMSKETGIRPDFIYGVQSRESAGKYNAMALNPHISISKEKRKGKEKGYSWATSDAKLQKYMGEEGYQKWLKDVEAIKSLGVTGSSIPGVTNQGFNHPVYKKMRSVDPELAILGNALGLYQVLGGHLLPHWGGSAAKLEADFERNPREVGNKAFVIWVNKHRSFVTQVNASEDNWFDQIKRYYGADNLAYTKHVKAAAAEYRAAAINKKGLGSGSSGGESVAALTSWRDKLGKNFARKENFHRLKDSKNNFRAGIKDTHTDPTVEFFEDLRNAFGIKSVITLNGDKTGKKAHASAKKVFGADNAFYFPSNDDGKTLVIGPGRTNTQANFEKIKAQLSKGNTLIHCTHGADRTGATVGRYYVDIGITSTSGALSDAKQYKSGKFYPEMRNFIYNGPT